MGRREGKGEIRKVALGESEKRVVVPCGGEVVVRLAVQGDGDGHFSCHGKRSSAKFSVLSDIVWVEGQFSSVELLFSLDHLKALYIFYSKILFI